MNLQKFAAAALIIVALIPAVASADGHKGRKSQQFFAEIGITPEQEAKLKEIHAKSIPLKKAYKEQLEARRAMIKAELQKDKPSKSALNKHAAEIGNLHKHMNQSFIDDLLKIKDILTPEQYARLSEKGFIGDPGSMKMRDRDRDRDSDRDRKDCGAFKPGEGPKHRYGPPPGGQGKYKEGGPKDCQKKRAPGGGGFVPTDPFSGTLPEDGTGADINDITEDE